jgi:outer membrane protein TolC
MKPIINTMGIFFALGFVASNATESIIFASINNHPNVVEKANEITLKGINIDQILAEDGLKVNLSTKTKLKIDEQGDNTSENLARVENLTRDYLDLEITIRKNLYDFGVVEYKLDAENNRKKALELEFQQIFEKTLQKLLNTANDIGRINTVLDNLNSSIVTAKTSISEIRTRFTSGIGTVMDVRQAQLLLLDLETEAQVLTKEYEAKIIILKDEFDIYKGDISVVTDKLKMFKKQLSANQNGINQMIGEALYYPRSEKIIKLEKYALNSQIKALKSEDMPQLNANITSIVYDITRGSGERQVYGGINLTMPLFDGGLSNVKKRGLTYKIKVQDDRLDALNQEKLLELNKLTKKYQSLQIEYDSAQEKLTNITEKLAQITQRMAVVDEGLLTKLQTQLQLAKIKRDLLAYPYSMQSLNIDYWALSERLIEKAQINLTR